MTIVKFCGLTGFDDIMWANKLRPDYIGFVFAAGSRRYVTPTSAAELKQKLDRRISAVGVFVDADREFILELERQQIIDAIQLHGNENELYIKELKQKTSLPIIKAFSISGCDDVEKAESSSADYVLLDSGAGGTGNVFDWDLLRLIKRPYFLAGGLDWENVAKAVGEYKPFAVDVSSGIETNGKKDPEKMTKFIRAVHGADGVIE